MNLDQHVLKNMFEKSMFSDLSLAFFHDSFPFTMRFDVHKAVVAQSPFFRLLLENTHRLRTMDPASTDRSLDSQQTSNPSSSQSSNGTLHLTIDLIEALTRRGFIMTPSSNIIRRQWQRQTTPLNELSSAPVSSEDRNSDGTYQTRHILGSHLRFALKWLYSMERGSMVHSLQDEDTLRVLCVAVLFGLDTLVDDCLERYTTRQLSIDAITDDLETICQLPRDHKAYLQLRDAALLLLFRFGPQYPRHLARLPVDYMSDVLSVDLLFIGSEYERYCLLREVLVAYMQSVGKITWTPTGPVDQDFKRLSGFVQNPILQQQQQQQLKQHQHHLSALDVRSAKRKRIPSEELDLFDSSNGSNEHSHCGGSGGDEDTSTSKHQRLARLSFSACIPFEKLVADASSGGVIDKATILSYLLRTTVNYSNMTFDQLAIVRQDGIVNESIVFRALWQREELDRLLFPFNYHQSQHMSASTTLPTSDNTTQHTIIPRFGKLGKSNNGGGTKDAMDRRAALDEYFDVGEADDKGRRRRMLLGTPRFRFCASIPVVLPGTKSGDDDVGDEHWDLVQLASNDGNEAAAVPTKQTKNATTKDNGPSDIFDDDYNDDNDDSDDDNDSVWVCEDERETLDRSHHVTETYAMQNKDHHALEGLTIGETTAKTTEQGDKGVNTEHEGKQQVQQKQNSMHHWAYNKTVYSKPECILGHWHRVRLEMQLLPRSLVSNQTEGGLNVGQGENKDKKRDELNMNQGVDDKVLICRFELQRDRSATKTSSSRQQHQQQQKHTNNSNNTTSLHENATQHPLSKSDSQLQDSKSASQQTKIRYDIYCLNRHLVLNGSDHVDPEDRVLIPVSKVTEANDALERSTGYVKQVKLNMDALDDKKKMKVDMVVALEILGLQKT